MPMQPEPILVSIATTIDGVTLESSVGNIKITTTHPEKCNFANLCDYAAWYFLPVAMRLNRPLHIAGYGSSQTIINWQKLAEIWQSWLPGHFYATNLNFDQVVLRAPKHQTTSPDLMFYSGGVDAAHLGLLHLQENKQQDLLTVHGMDYSLEDQQRFSALLSKTAIFAQELSTTRIIVKSDAYQLYNDLGVNLGRHHLNHIFALVGAGFFHSESYDNLILADDEPLAAQFLSFPWGTNAVTNPLFDDGQTKLITQAQGVPRIEKLKLINSSETALNSLAFCWNRKLQPVNCGVCEKCLRTKMLCLAEFGVVPDIFLDKAIPSNWIKTLNYRGAEGFFIVQEIFRIAQQTGNSILFPDFQKSLESVFRYHQIFRRVENIWPRFLRPGFVAQLAAKVATKFSGGM